MVTGWRGKGLEVMSDIGPCLGLRNKSGYQHKRPIFSAGMMLFKSRCEDYRDSTVTEDKGKSRKKKNVGECLQKVVVEDENACFFSELRVLSKYSLNCAVQNRYHKCNVSYV